MKTIIEIDSPMLYEASKTWTDQTLKRLLKKHRMSHGNQDVVEGCKDARKDIKSSMSGNMQGYIKGDPNSVRD